MKRLRQLIIALLLLFAIFFNIERLDFGQQNVIDIETFVYGLGTLAVISILIVPFLRTLPVSTSLILWSTVYFVSKLFFLSDRPLLGGVHTYVTITEICLIFSLIWLAYQLVQSLHDFEKAVEDITFSDSSSRVRKLEEAKDLIQTEMFRSRYNHHDLSVIIVEPQPESIKATLHRIVREVQQTMMSYYVINNMSRVLDNHLRRSDLVLEQQEKNRIMLICPETNDTDATMLIDYIEDVVTRHFDLSITCGTATFPNQALTFEELVRQAEAHLQVSQEQSPSPTPVSVN